MSKYTLAVPFDDSAASRAAIWRAARLCNQIGKYRLLVIHVTALNASSRAPALDNLERANNADIKQKASAHIEAVKNYLAKLQPQVDYEWVSLEGEGPPGPLIEKYIKEKVPECDLVMIGTRGLTGLKKVLLGSVSEYCVAHLPCPVAVVRPN